MPVEACCCDEAMPAKQSAPDLVEHDCCELRSEFTLKEPDPDEALAAIVPKPPTEGDRLPVFSLLLLAAVWPNVITPEKPVAFWQDHPLFADVGTKTYLRTQRLRI